MDSPSNPELKADLVESLYSKIGGVPRYVLDVAETFCSKGLERNKIEDKAYLRVQEAINGVEDMQKLLQYISQEKHSSQLPHRWPKEDDVGESYLKWASHHIQKNLSTS